MKLRNPAGCMVLVVVPDAQERLLYRKWLERKGFEVIGCPGPSTADGCVGLRGGSCELASAADVVVLDHRAGREQELEAHYLLSGKPIVALGRRTQHFAPFGREWMIRLPWPPTEAPLVSAVRYQALAGGPSR